MSSLATCKLVKLNSIRSLFNKFCLSTWPNSLQKSKIHTSSFLLAGHSKWANIRHTKGAKDAEKSLIYNKYSNLIKTACKEGGNVDPNLNSKLARVIAQARVLNVPQSIIDSAIKNIEKAELNAKPHTISFSAPGGIFIIADLQTDNVNRTRQQILQVLKKVQVNFKEQRGGTETMFDEKGFIVTSGDLNKAMDDAIEAGAEDVTQEGDSLTFVCNPNDFHSVHQKIEELNYDVSYAGVDQIPLVMVPLKEVEKMKIAFGKLEQIKEIQKLHYNFEIDL